ncbi:hypothetical protein [Streptomyces altiplanensis]
MTGRTVGNRTGAVRAVALAACASPAPAACGSAKDSVEHPDGKGPSSTR